MPVRKYRSVADMPSALWLTPGDPKNLAVACELSATAVRLSRRRWPAGVYRYTSVEEAAARRDAWEREADPAPDTLS